MDGGDVGDVACVAVSPSGGEYAEDVGDVGRMLWFVHGDAAERWITSTMTRERNDRHIPAAVVRFPTITGIGFSFAAASQVPVAEPRSVVTWLRACSRRS